MSGSRRLALIAAAVVVVIVAFIALRPSDSSKKGGTKAVQEVVVKGGKPVGGVKTLTFAKGDTVEFKVTSDVADEVHVHGYDIHKDVAPGRPVTFHFPGKIDGGFVVELEKRSEQIASLQVTP